MKAVGYCRISDSDQSSNSIEFQESGIVDYCKRNNVILEKVFIEDGRSAFTFDRKEWKDLESYVKSNKDIRYLVVYHLDRFSRANLLDALQKMDEIQRKLKIKILTITDPIDINLDDQGVQILRTIQLIFSNNELKRIRERTTDGIYKSLSDGRYCSKAPIGYLNGKDVNGRPLLQVDPEKMELIRTIFKSYIRGMGIEEIRRLPSISILRIKGNSTIQRILDNPVYAGMIHLPAYKGKPSQIIKGIHPPIVSEYDYWLVQNRLHAKTRTTQNKDEVFLRGVLKTESGKLMTAGNSKGRKKHYWYYVDRGTRKHYPAEKLHKQMYEILKILSLSKSDVEFLEDNLRKWIVEKEKSKGGDLMQANLSLQKVQQKIKSTQEKYLLQPDIDEKVYKEVITVLKNEESTILENIAFLSSEQDAFWKAFYKRLPELSNLVERFNNFTLPVKQGFLNIVFCNNLFIKDGIYRTNSLHTLFADKVQILKRKKLLIVEQPSFVRTAIPVSAGEGNWIEPLLQFKDFFSGVG